MSNKNKATVDKLREKDPEFFAFLKSQEANLDDFEELDELDEAEIEGGDDSEEDAVNSQYNSDQESSLSEQNELEEEDEPDTDNEKVVVREAEESKRLSKRKKYKKSLEDALKEMDDSDLDENETDYTEGSLQPLTPSLLRQWEKDVETNNITMDLIENISSVFKSVATKAGAKIDNVSYAINSVKGFGKALTLCYESFPKLWRKEDKQDSNSNFKKPAMRFKAKLLRPIIKEYFCDMIKFLPEIQDNNTMLATLNHLSNAMDFAAMFPRKSRILLKALVKIWVSGEYEHQVTAFKCIKSVVLRLKDELFIFTFRRMYSAYSGLNSLKATSDAFADNKSNYLQRSFADLCSVDSLSTYQNAFIYIRDLAISLRNAIQFKKEDNWKVVHCRRFVNSLYLWSVVLNKSSSDENVSQLLYPLAQVIIGCCRQITTSKYSPFRIHCVKCLLLLTRGTSLFVPILTLITNITTSLVSSTKSSKAIKFLTSKTVTSSDLDTIVKLSKSQLDEQTYKSAVLDKLSDLTVETLQRLCCLPSFFEATFLFAAQMKQFCKSATVNKSISDERSVQSVQCLRQIVAKLEAHCKWLEIQRSKFGLDLNDEQSLETFKANVLADTANPMLQFCRSYKTLSERQKRVQFADEQKKIKQLQQPASSKRPTKRKFTSVKSRDNNNCEEKLTGGRRKKMKDSKKKLKCGDSIPDIVQDLDVSDYE